MVLLEAPHSTPAPKAASLQTRREAATEAIQPSHQQIGPVSESEILSVAQSLLEPLLIRLLSHQISIFSLFFLWYLTVQFLEHRLVHVERLIALKNIVGCCENRQHQSREVCDKTHEAVQLVLGSVCIFTLYQYAIEVAVSGLPIEALLETVGHPIVHVAHVVHSIVAKQKSIVERYVVLVRLILTPLRG